MEKAIKDVKKGEIFEYKNKTYYRGEYNRTVKKYSCTPTTDANEEKFFKPLTVVNPDVTY